MNLGLTLLPLSPYLLEGMESSLILSENQISQKILRMAYEIYENNLKEKEIIIAGIEGQGTVLAKSLAKAVEKISPVKVILVKISIDKEKPESSEITIDQEPKILKKKVIILVDDVLNTGRTFAYGMRPFLSFDVKKIEVAVLVDRGHTLFPVSAKYRGYELSTTLNETIIVNLESKKKGVYLQ